MQSLLPIINQSIQLKTVVRGKHLRKGDVIDDTRICSTQVAAQLRLTNATSVKAQRVCAAPALCTVPVLPLPCLHFQCKIVVSYSA